jgi:ABC-type multidrug transport system ATPase subunit
VDVLRCDRLIVDRGGRIVVDRVNLEAGPGDAVAVIGRSGAGKSSLLGAVAGSLPIAGGDCLVAGRSLRHDGDAARAALGFVPAQPVAWPGVEAGQFLAVFAAAAGLTGRGLHEAVRRGLAAAGLEAYGRAPIDALPDGCRKRLLIARACLHSPGLLVMDDPCGGLDPAGLAELERLVGDMHIGGRTVIAAIDDARVPDCFTHLAVLQEGELVRFGPAAFAAHAAGRRWRFRLRCPGAAEAARRCLAGATPPVAACDPVDAHTVELLLDVDRSPPAGVVAHVVRAGIAVESFGPHPPWTVQLLDGPA